MSFTENTEIQVIFFLWNAKAWSFALNIELSQKKKNKIFFIKRLSHISKQACRLSVTVCLTSAA